METTQFRQAHLSATQRKRKEKELLQQPLRLCLKGKVKDAKAKLKLHKKCFQAVSTIEKDQATAAVVPRVPP